MNKEILDTELDAISIKFAEIKKKVNQYIVGNENVTELLIIGLLSEGHVLIEGPPGTAKTTIAKIMASLMGLEFKRVQCTVDTQPADIIGAQMWDSKTKEFALIKGPIFTNILLVDEANRLPPKSQSAFVEVIHERQATIDGLTMRVGNPFFTIATQNPYESEGIFKLIDVQKDRFSFSINIDYLDGEGELEIIKRDHEGILDLDCFNEDLEPILYKNNISSFIEYVKKIRVEESIQEYIKNLILRSRNHKDLKFGISSRGSIALIRGSKANAALQNRKFVIPDDVKKILPLVFKHRLGLHYEAEMSGINRDDVIEDILNSVKVL